MNNIGSLKADSPFRPTYEDTFDLIEEFLLVSLYDDWKSFIEAEETYFSHVSRISCANNMFLTNSNCFMSIERD